MVDNLYYPSNVTKEADGHADRGDVAAKTPMYLPPDNVPQRSTKAMRSALTA
jgi:hypothetical protein